MKRNYESSIFDHIKVKGKYVLKKRRNWVCVCVCVETLPAYISGKDDRSYNWLVESIV